jgi:serine/threonine-protein kinase
MAEVYLAVARGPAGFNKLVVLKRLLPGLAGEPSFLTMFLDEARLAAQLNHPNIVQTNEVGFDAERYFIAMEYLDGQPLVRILHKVGPEGLPIGVALRVVANACAGLHYAHTLADFNGASLGIVHRDVSPHNVFVTYAGQVKIVDFGIAKAANRSTDTQTGVLKGKIAYMSPEQLGDQDLDGRSDVFSLGVVLYEALTRKRLWGSRPRDIDIFKRLVSGDIPSSPREVVPGLPEDVDRICRRALAVNREDRYPSALDMQKDIEETMARLAYRPSERDVGDVVAPLFIEERRTIASTIERQLRELDSLASGEFSIRTLPSLNIGGTTSSTPAGMIGAHSGPIAHAPRSRWPLAVAAGGGGLIVLIAIVALVAARAGSGPKPTASALGSAEPSADTPSAAAQVAPVRAPEPSTESSATASVQRPLPAAVRPPPFRYGAGGGYGAGATLGNVRGAPPAAPQAAAPAQAPPVTSSVSPASTATPTYGPLDGRH